MSEVYFPQPASIEAARTVLGTKLERFFGPELCDDPALVGWYPARIVEVLQGREILPADPSQPIFLDEIYYTLEFDDADAEGNSVREDQAWGVIFNTPNAARAHDLPPAAEALRQQLVQQGGKRREPRAVRALQAVSPLAQRMQGKAGGKQLPRQAKQAGGKRAGGQQGQEGQQAQQGQRKQQPRKVKRKGGDAAGSRQHDAAAAAPPVPDDASTPGGRDPARPQAAGAAPSSSLAAAAAAAGQQAAEEAAARQRRLEGAEGGGLAALAQELAGADPGQVRQLLPLLDGLGGALALDAEEVQASGGGGASWRFKVVLIREKEERDAYLDELARLLARGDAPGAASWVRLCTE
eukprot:scaffold17.g516.t1